MSVRAKDKIRNGILIGIVIAIVIASLFYYFIKNKKTDLFAEITDSDIQGLRDSEDPGMMLKLKQKISAYVANLCKSSEIGVMWRSGNWFFHVILVLLGGITLFALCLPLFRKGPLCMFGYILFVLFYLYLLAGIYRGNYSSLTEKRAKVDLILICISFPLFALLIRRKFLVAFGGLIWLAIRVIPITLVMMFFAGLQGMEKSTSDPFSFRIIIPYFVYCFSFVSEFLTLLSMTFGIERSLDTDTGIRGVDDVISNMTGDERGGMPWEEDSDDYNDM